MDVTLSDGLLVLILGGVANAIWLMASLRTEIKGMRGDFREHVSENDREHQEFRHDIKKLDGRVTRLEGTT